MDKSPYLLLVVGSIAVVISPWIAGYTIRSSRAFQNRHQVQYKATLIVYEAIALLGIGISLFQLHVIPQPLIQTLVVVVLLTISASALWLGITNSSLSKNSKNRSEE